MQSLASGFTFPGKAIRLPWSLAMLPISSRVSASYPSTCIVTITKKASKARYQPKPIIGTRKCSASGIETESQMLKTAAHRRKKTSRSTCSAQFFRISRNLDASSAAAHKAHACNPVARIRNDHLATAAPIHEAHPPNFSMAGTTCEALCQKIHISKRPSCRHPPPKKAQLLTRQQKETHVEVPRPFNPCALQLLSGRLLGEAIPPHREYKENEEGRKEANPFHNDTLWPSQAQDTGCHAKGTKEWADDGLGPSRPDQGLRCEAWPK